jgi:hypothetical protein
MRNAETVLAIIQERGKESLALEDVYRQLYNPDLYLKALLGALIGLLVTPTPRNAG